MTWRYFAQQALTGEIIDLDLPIRRDELSWALSGPGALRGTINPEYADLKWSNGKPLLGEWGAYLYAEENSQIRWGGILQRSQYVGSSWTLEAYGFSSYAAGIPYTGPLYSKTAHNPVRAFKDIWNHVQDQPDGSIGLTVAGGGGCPVTVGTKEEPYVLAWWEAPDCGAELDRLAAETPFDYAESHAWAAASGDQILHRLDISYPRLGHRRTDLAFTSDNVTNLVELTRDGQPFANIVYALGKGEGSKTLRGEDGVRDGRLRRPAIYTDKLASTAARCSALAKRERRLRTLGFDVQQITVADHPNAPIGSWSLGDDILLQLEVPHIGKVALWFRVVGWSLETESTASITVTRADTFQYGAPPLPGAPVTVPPSTLFTAVVATLNTHRSTADVSGHSWNSRKANCIAAINSINPTLFGAQECTPTQAADIAAGCTYSYIRKGNVVIFWRPAVWSCLNSDSYDLEYGNDDRWLIAGSFKHTASGVTVRAGSTHLTNLEGKDGGDGWRIGQLKEILSYEPKIQILFGDFNSPADVYAQALKLAGLGQSRAKAPIGAQTNRTLNSSHKDYVNTQSKSRRIDEVLTRPDIVVTAGGVLNLDGTGSFPNASDHNMVYATIGAA